MGEDTAFIPIGLSCQVARQLEHNKAFLAFLLQQDLTYTSSFFNWTITSAAEIPSILRKLVSEAIVPGSIRVPDAPNELPMLAGHNLWFWHEKPSHLVDPEILSGIERKYEHLRQNFLRLATKAKRIFIIASAQNDLLSQYPYLRGEQILFLSQSLIENIQTTLDEIFPEGRNFLFVVGKADRFEEGYASYVLPPENTEWVGDEHEWRKLLIAFLSTTPLLESTLPVLASSSNHDQAISLVRTLLDELTHERWQSGAYLAEINNLKSEISRLHGAG